ncbi:MAG: hypothetical protein M2R46_04614 [Verrucomicrobia subdivision 3 bacterium]|nr:hypothetical protein [Limisphaerales bacterium]MCS1416861.1 hypothetical protein [Limisphaerales bacterium]
MMLRNVALSSNVSADADRAYGALDALYSIARVNHNAGEYELRGIPLGNGQESLHGNTSLVEPQAHAVISGYHMFQTQSSKVKKNSTKELPWLISSSKQWHHTPAWNIESC